MNVTTEDDQTAPKLNVSITKRRPNLITFFLFKFGQELPETIKTGEHLKSIELLKTEKYP